MQGVSDPYDVSRDRISADTMEMTIEAPQSTFKHFIQSGFMVCICNPITQKAEQEDHQSELNLGYLASFRPAWETQCDSLSKSVSSIKLYRSKDIIPI